MQNYWLFLFVVAVFGVEWRFYTWHQPQIEELEKMREEKIKTAIKRFLSQQELLTDSPEHLGYLHDFFNELTLDRDMVFPVGGDLNPHKKIFRLLLAAIILSLCYGIFAIICLPSVESQIHFSISDATVFYIKLALAILTVIPLCLAARLGWTEFEYVLRIKEKFKTHPSKSNELHTNHNQTAALQVDDTKETSKFEQMTVKDQLPAPPHSQTRNDELAILGIEVLKLFLSGKPSLETGQVAGKLKLHQLRAEQLLEGLAKQDYLHASTRIGLPRTYRLASKGRDYLIENNLI